MDDTNLPKSVDLDNFDGDGPLRFVSDFGTYVVPEPIVALIVESHRLQRGLEAWDARQLERIKEAFLAGTQKALELEPTLEPVDAAPPVQKE